MIGDLFEASLDCRRLFSTSLLLLIFDQSVTLFDFFLDSRCLVITAPFDILSPNIVCVIKCFVA
jgi:hypothetical protein